MDIKKIKKKIPNKKPKITRPSLPRPKITFDRLGQITFTLKEVAKLALRIKPRLLVTLFVLNAFWGFLAIPGFYLEKLIIDELIEAAGKNNLQFYIISIGLLVLIALLISLFRNLLGSFNMFLRNTMARYFEAELSIMLGKKLVSLDMAMIDDPKFQDKFNKVEQESGRRAWGLMVPLSDIPNFLVGFLASVGVLIFLNPLIAIGVLLVSIPQFFVDSKYIKKEYALHTELTPLRRIWGWTNYYLVRSRNYMELKLLGISDFLSNKMRSAVDDILKKRTHLRKQRQMFRIFGQLPLTLFELIVSLFLIFWVIIQKITIGSFQLYLRSLRSAEQNLSGLVNSFVQIYENYIYVSDLVWFLNLKPDIEMLTKGKKITSDTVDLSLNNVWFRYKKDQKWILKGVDLKIDSGEKIAIVGENGVGKSTLIKLVARFYDPQKGSVELNGRDLREYKLSDWRNRLAIMFQEFEGYIYSVREAIGYGDIRNLEDEEGVKLAAEDAGIDEYVQGLPLKYENPLNPRFEKGVKPSTGQRQRIGLARFLFRKNAKLLILDEPTSNVDPKAEEQIFNRLLKKMQDRTFIFVSQRFSTVRRAERILVMDKGKIVEDGSHEELMEKKGLYEELFSLQAKAYQ